ncbi:hypothetical protein AAHA92_22689 [Salvia divinorum]|uniref:Uncharacterized protein n=1 Tax=Salvia divinorum TaxID=28513 RepID=A0ABD1GPH3_SALDI
MKIQISPDLGFELQTTEAYKYISFATIYSNLRRAIIVDVRITRIQNRRQKKLIPSLRSRISEGERCHILSPWVAGCCY